MMDVHSHPYEKQDRAFPILLRRPEVERRTGLSRSGIYVAIKEGSFPAPITLNGTRSVAWIEREISDWIEGQIAATRKQADPNPKTVSGDKLRKSKRKAA